MDIEDSQIRLKLLANRQGFLAGIGFEDPIPGLGEPNGEGGQNQGIVIDDEQKRGFVRLPGFGILHRQTIAVKAGESNSTQKQLEQNSEYVTNPGGVVPAALLP